MADGSLIFDTKIDTSDFESGVSKLQSKSESLKKPIEAKVDIDTGNADADLSKITVTARQAAAQISQSYRQSGMDASSAMKQAWKDVKEAQQNGGKVIINGVEKIIDENAKLQKSAKDVGDALADAYDDAGNAAKRAADRVTKRGERVAKSTKKSFGDIKSIGEQVEDSLTGLATKVLSIQFAWEAAGKLVDFGKKAIGLASDLNEVQNVVDVTFGTSAGKINSFAKEATAQFGISELQAKKYTGTLGAMAKSMGMTEEAAADMSMSLTGLVGDMASFYNLDYETAFEKIRSGISGETEPLKQLGINMSVANMEAYRLTQGITKQYDKMSELEKVQLRYNYLMSATSDAQGDFSRTQEGYSNQIRLLKNNFDALAATIGAQLLPAATSAVQALNGLITDITPKGATIPVVVDIGESITTLEGLETALTEANNNYFSKIYQIQIDYQQAQDAIFKIESLKALTDGYDSASFDLKVGSTGERVKGLQEALNAVLGTDLAVDGVFGPKTQAAVSQFQEKMGLAATGTFSLDTALALMTASKSTSVETIEAVKTACGDLSSAIDGIDFSKISLGSTGEDVTALQSALETLTGMDLSSENGVWGSKSVEALQAFQNAMGLSTAGVIDLETQLALIGKTNETAKQAVSDLVAAYPALAEYVGSDGLFSEEIDVLQEVIDLQRKAAIEAAIAERIQAMTTALIDANIAMQELKFNEGQAQAQLDAEQQRLEELLALRKQIAETGGLINESDVFSWGMVSPEKLAQDAEAMQAIFDIMSKFAGLTGNQEMFAMLSENGVDVNVLRDSAGALKDIEDMDASGLLALIDAYKALSGGLTVDNEANVGGELVASIDDSSDTIDELETAVTDAQTAIAQGEADIATASANLATAQATSVDEVIAGMDAINNKMDEGVDTSEAESDIKTFGRNIKSYIDNLKLKVKVGVSLPSLSGLSGATGHATGLENVPYDNYYARLHRGEMVLTAAQAAEYRKGNNGAASTPVVVNVAPANVSLDVDGRKFAETTARSNNSAINSYKRRVAKGKGL